MRTGNEQRLTLTGPEEPKNYHCFFIEIWKSKRGRFFWEKIRSIILDMLDVRCLLRCLSGDVMKGIAPKSLIFKERSRPKIKIWKLIYR